jgi:DNA-binding NarL/FixJ family response regulator
VKLTDNLTARQRAVLLERIKHGGNIKRAARGLGIAIDTVNWHSKQAFARLGCDNLLQAALIAQREGLIQ